MWFIAVDDLFKEADIEPNGKVKYDEFIHKVTIPMQDYWIKRRREPPLGLRTQTDAFLKRNVFLSLEGDGKPSKHTELTTAENSLVRKLNDFGYGIS